MKMGKYEAVRQAHAAMMATINAIRALNRDLGRAYRPNRKTDKTYRLQLRKSIRLARIAKTATYELYHSIHNEP